MACFSKREGVPWHLHVIHTAPCGCFPNPDMPESARIATSLHQCPYRLGRCGGGTVATPVHGHNRAVINVTGKLLCKRRPRLRCEAPAVQEEEHSGTLSSHVHGKVSPQCRDDAALCKVVLLHTHTPHGSVPVRVQHGRCRVRQSCSPGGALTGWVEGPKMDGWHGSVSTAIITFKKGIQHG